MILGKYKITYENGISQTKNLIYHRDYLNKIKIAENEIYEIEKANKFKPTEESKRLKAYIKTAFGEYFTDESPLFKAISTGILELPSHQGLNHNVKIIRYEI